MTSTQTQIGAGSPSLSTPLLACSCEPCAIPQMLFNHRPGAVFAWAVECPYCGKATTWRKTEKSAAETWNDRHANSVIDMTSSDNAKPTSANRLEGRP